MTENNDRKSRLTILTAIASAISAWVASAVILASIGYGSYAAFTIAPIIAAAVFGAFMVKIYATSKKARFPVATPTTTPANQRCLILAAPTHGMLQDRANYWLEGRYGSVTGSSMAVNEKGFYLTIFYREVTEITEKIKELPLKEETEPDADSTD